MKKKVTVASAVGLAIALAGVGVVPAWSAPSARASSDDYVLVRTVPELSPPMTTDVSGVRVTNDGIAQTQMCDVSQVLQSSSADGPGTLGLSFARQIQSQASLSVAAGVSASATAEVGLNATVGGFGATGKLGTTVGTSLSTTFGYDVLDFTLITSSYSTPIPDGETWSVSAYPAYTKYDYSVYANSWQGGASAIATGQLLSPVGYCYKITRPKSLGVYSGFATSDSATSGSAVRYQPSQVPGLSKWTALPDGSIRLSGGDLCLEPKAIAGQFAEPIEVSTCNGGANQSWRYVGQTLVNGLSGKCLDLPASSTAPGSQLIAWQCSGGDNQKWTF